MTTGERQIERAEAAVALATERAVDLVRRRLPQGPGRLDCADCGIEIPEARRVALPGVETCIDCRTDRERNAGWIS